MKYLSVCSGIEAATVAWYPLGWQPWAFAEIDAFPSAVLAHYYSTVPNLGDMTSFHDWPDATFDLLVGGTPCQSFSVAGLRAGLDDPRGNLLLVYLAVARRYRPRWLVWENVPGVLSSDEGRAFGALLGGLAELGYGFAYRVLDAQYFELAQRRARVFVVAHLGDWRRAAAVLFERESLSGHPAPCREAGEDVAGTIASRASAGGGLGTDFDCDGGLVPERARALTSSNQRIDYETETLIAHPLLGKANSSHDHTMETYVAHSLRADGFDASEDGTGRGTPIVPIVAGTLKANNGGGGWSNSADHAAAGYMVPVAFSSKDYGADCGELAPTLRAGAHDKSHANGGCMPAVAFQEAQTSCREYESAGTLRANGPGHDPVGTRIREGMQVRRLTPRECERLQGFPDDYTLIPYRGKLAKDGPRYKALGNSMAVPTMRWIGRRIQMVEELERQTGTPVGG